MCMCKGGEIGLKRKMKSVKIQLLSSSSVAVSTSQDFDDNATITAFCGGNKKTKSLILQQNSAL